MLAWARGSQAEASGFKPWLSERPEIGAGFCQTPESSLSVKALKALAQRSVIIAAVTFFFPLLLLLRGHLRSKRRLATLVLLLLLEDVASRLSVLTLPASPAFQIPKRPRMTVAWICTSLKFEAALNLQTTVPRQIAYVPESIRLAFEQRHHYRAIEREQLLRRSEEFDEQFLVEADLSVDICAFATDVREVEEDVIVESRFAQSFVLVKFRSVDIVDDRLALFFDVLDVLLSLGFVFLEQLGLAVVAGGRHVAAAVVFDYGFGK